MVWRDAWCPHCRSRTSTSFRVLATWARSRIRSKSMRSWHDSSSRLSQRDLRHAMFSADGPIRLRLMTEQDLPMLQDWLSRPHIVEWWGGERPTLEQVRHDYMPGVLARQRVTPYIATLDGEPFAYAQS